jgi:hypothetical protein
VSSTLHVASHENPYVAECLRLGILAAQSRPPNDEDWATESIERCCIPLIEELNASSSDGIGYVRVPKPIKWVCQCSDKVVPSQAVEDEDGILVPIECVKCGKRVTA